MVATYAGRETLERIASLATAPSTHGSHPTAPQLLVLPAPGATSIPSERANQVGSSCERAGLRVGRAVGRLCLRLRPVAEVPAAPMVSVTSTMGVVAPARAAESVRLDDPPGDDTTGQGRINEALRPARPVARVDGMVTGPTSAKTGNMRGKPAAVPSARVRLARRRRAVAVATRPAPRRSTWRHVKLTLDIVDSVPALRAVVDALLGPWALDALIIGGTAIGLLYPGNPLGIASRHMDVLDLAVPLLKACLSALLSPLAVEVALALFGIGRVLWSRRPPTPRAALGA